ncbi:hypothetical protein PQC36_gp095 [Proteus phage Vb_PmiP-P59]|uniref:Uncharacterized protein n=1 Tax=Proteus phage Vb_PmiP-P59 TaxID=2754975 RepID=A0A7G5CG63_9CAUD|nr:hypothetical protein PQC36_gp095 [Proteus phage Vb_PmiP-P59]QMV48265.1 hypothetical protein [Proteus phage Vb_PmiP-P59]
MNTNFEEVFMLLDKMEKCANRIKELNKKLSRGLTDV